MIRHSLAATGAALAAFLFISCRDAPTSAGAPADSSLGPSFSSDSVTDLGPAEIHTAYTEATFYDGRNGGRPLVEIRAGMEYTGNRASMITSYNITGEGVSLSDRIVNQQDWFYQFLRSRKIWDELYTVPVDKDCGLQIEAHTQHAAWWFFWVRGLPNNETSKDVETTVATPPHIDPCEPEPPENTGDGTGSHGGWITIETCHYWAHYVNGALVSIELRYCTYDIVPVADE